MAWTSPAVARAATAVAAPIPQAWSLYHQGRALQARQGLEAYLGSQGQSPQERLIALETLLDICVQTFADPCLARYAPLYADLAGRRPVANSVQRIDAARRAGYYLFAAQAPQMSQEGLAAILANDNWKFDHPYDVGLYLRRRALSAQLNLRLGRTAAAERDVDKVLSLIASLDDAGTARPAVLWALSDVIETLLGLGDTERAYSLLRACAGMAATLPARSADLALFALRAGIVLDAAGRTEKAIQSLDLAIGTLDQTELDPQVRSRLLAKALTTKAKLCSLADVACAREALARHPLLGRYASADPAPGSAAEVEYLEARAMTAAISGTPDLVVASALQRPLGFRPEVREVEAIKVHQALGRALASPPGEARSRGLREAAQHVRTLARQQREATFGAWYRAGAFEEGVLRLTLAEAESLKGEDGADLVFTLMQLVQRRGQTFDADALTVLGQTRTSLERRSAHQALRLRARRDALERERIAKLADAVGGGGGAVPPKPNFGVRQQLRNYAERISAASVGLGEAGLATPATSLVTLKQMQSVLGPEEAALMLTPSSGDALVYMCVRRATSLRRVVRADRSALRGDVRLIQAALTAGHAPSEALDAQFPVAAATRLYDVFIRPFEPCLRPGDHILWLPGLSLTRFPLAPLLEQAPPKLERGYDLSAAAWLTRNHAVTYAGSAAVVVALRKAPAPAAAQFDFLGVGDPEFSGVTTSGEDRAKMVTRGVRAAGGVAALPPLPDTEAELRRSAGGFSDPHLLLEAAASEGGFRRELAGAYRYLSFATHGLIRDDLQGLSEPALALTPVSGASTLDDGLLTAPEIADFNLSARFVALSACNTANFDVGQMAQDLPALASAFAVAGVPATLGTLWPVDSATGVEVVSGVFERLRAGLAPAEALAESQRAFLAKPPSRARLHPRFWAPFVILGDGGVAAPVQAGSARPLKVSRVETPRGEGEILQVRRGAGGEVAVEDRLSLTAWSKTLGLERGAAVVGTGPLDGRQMIVASQRLDLEARTATVAVLITEDGSAPRRLFEIERPAASRVTFVRRGETVVVAYSSRVFPAPPMSPVFQDDYDQLLCASEPLTHVEIRDLATGALRAEAELKGRYVNTATASHDAVLLGGQMMAECGEARASVIAVDEALRVRDIYRDNSLGESDVRALSALPDGRILVAASKDNTVEFRLPTRRPTAASRAVVDGALYGGMVVVLDRDGAASEPLFLDAGNSVTVDAADASRADDILVGGGVGGRPAIFHLAAEAAR